MSGIFKGGIQVEGGTIDVNNPLPVQQENNEILAFGQLVDLEDETTEGGFTTLVSFTDATNDRRIDRVWVSGSVNAEYRYRINTTVRAVIRTSNPPNADWKINIKLDTGDTFDVQVKHNFPSTDADFDATIYGFGVSF